MVGYYNSLLRRRHLKGPKQTYDGGQMRQFVMLGAAICALTSGTEAKEPVNFSRDVLPILSDNCFGCHGQDEGHRKGELRLDVREAAIEKKAIIPGDSRASELIARIVSADPDALMPPPKSHKPKLHSSQSAILRQWIDEGAVWGKHWAFEPPRKAHSVGNPVDYFVRERLEQAGMRQAKEAEKHTLLRRISLDITGLPPSPEELDTFMQDTAPDAYSRAVERLLNSPHHGERMAMWWLDAARYSDTDGFQSDATRNNWSWRDWVVDAFNKGMPYDQFTLEQFAGDLLPGATPEQRLATCFHRNHMTNGEGGRDPEESRVDYVIDRINTVGTTWLGLTLGCTQCHSHKFDPISHADYYSLTAFFNSIDEDGKAGSAAKPFLSYQSATAARSVAEAQQFLDERKPAEAAARKNAEAPFEKWLEMRRSEVTSGWNSWRTLKATGLESAEGTDLRQEADGAVQSSGPHPNQDEYRFTSQLAGIRISGLKLEVLPHSSHTGGALSRGASGEFILTDIKVQVRTRGNSQVREITLANAVADTMADKKKNNNYGDVKDTLDDDPRNGWTTQGADKNTPHTAVYALAVPLTLATDEELIVELRQRSTLGDSNIGRFRISVTSEAGEAVNQIGLTPREELAALGKSGALDASLRSRLFSEFLADHAPYLESKSALDRAMRQFNEIKTAAGSLNVMVLAERKEPRETFVLLRGVWDKHGEKVTPDVPAAIAPWQPDYPKNRIGFAQWITSKQNPLAARVAVNHLWQMLFGAGLVRTTEDFGLQGERPSHPELLDWLAVDLMEHAWDLKHTLRLILNSATYRQDSATTEALRLADPDNRLLARGSRYRLPSWMLRDSALRASGLLNPALGGPPVRPYQPEGVWEELFMGRYKYEPSEGPAQYRRTLYAFWRRSIAPTFLFDSAQRRSCEVRTGRTNTPLQALTLLNDGTFMEAARELAQRMLALPENQRIDDLYKRVLCRAASAQEKAVLARELQQSTAHYAANPQDARALLEFGQRRPGPGSNVQQLAAHTILASLTLNLDESLTHE